MTRDSGVYTRAQLLQAGYDTVSLRKAVAVGDLIRLRNGWFALRTHHTDVASAVKGGGALACVAALRWHGLWVPPGYPEPHVRRTRRKSAGRRSCSAIGGPYPVTDPVDSVTLALACAARCMTTEDWVATCDSYFNTSGTTAAEFLAALGHPGDGRLTRLLAMTDPAAQSGTESTARVRLKACGFDVVSQPVIDGVGRVDLRVGLVLIECDSVQHHTDLAAYQKDRDRDRKAVVGGWITLRLTYDDVLFGWDEVLQDLRAITRRDRHRARSARTRAAVAKSLHASGQLEEAKRAANVERGE